MRTVKGKLFQSIRDRCAVRRNEHSACNRRAAKVGGGESAWGKTGQTTPGAAPMPPRSCWVNYKLIIRVGVSEDRRV